MDEIVLTLIGQSEVRALLPGGRPGFIPAEEQSTGKVWAHFEGTDTPRPCCRCGVPVTQGWTRERDRVDATYHVACLRCVTLRVPLPWAGCYAIVDWSDT